MLATTPSTPSTATMRAAVHRAYGGPEVVGLAEVPRPTAPGPGEVLVEVRAAGLDRGTWHVMTGTPYAIRLAGFGVRAPKRPVLGLDLAGVVLAVGDGVTRVRPGDEVFGIGKGSFAEVAVARADKLALKPSGLSFEQAAVLGVSGLTALRGMIEVGRVQAGQEVLVTGASGGVGTYAVQMGVAAGATVTGVASTAKLDLVRSLGATHVIDYTAEDPLDGSRRYDLVLDLAGSASVSRLRRVLTPHGTLVLGGGENGNRWFGPMGRQLSAALLTPFVRQRLRSFIARERYPGLEQLAAMVEAGDLVTALDRAYPLEQAGDAMRHLVDGRVRGKIAIVP